MPLLDLLQVVSLPAELLGLTLALVEIRFEKVAAHFRAQILRSDAEFQQPTLSRTVGQRVVLILAVAVAANAIWLAVAMWDTLDAGLLRLIAGFSIITLILVVAGRWLTHFGLRALLSFVSRFAPGREIGTLGVAIAMIGIACEAVQFYAVFRALPDGTGIAFWLGMGLFGIAALAVGIGGFAFVLGLIDYWFPGIFQRDKSPWRVAM